MSKALIDLSLVPAPTIIRPRSFNELLDEMVTTATAEHPPLAEPLALESTPSKKLLRAAAYRRELDYIEFNDRARGRMLAYATGADLDQLAADENLTRHVIQEGNDSTTPPRPQIVESDDALRRRVRLARLGSSVAGPVAAYQSRALNADGRVKSVGVDSPAPGRVRVSILSHGTARGAPSAELIEIVRAALVDPEFRQLCEPVEVIAPTIRDYEIRARLTMLPGPDQSEVLANAIAGVERYADLTHDLERDVEPSMITAALGAPGVKRVLLDAPLAPMVNGAHEAGYCTGVAVTAEGVDV